MSFVRMLRESARIGGIVAMLFAVACGEEDTTITETEGGGRIVETETAAGEAIRAEIPAAGELPSGFPEDVPRYPGSTPTNSMSVPGQGTLVVFSSSAAGSEVIEFYTDAFGDLGWTVDVTQPGTALKASKASRTVSLFVMPSGDGSEIALTIGEG